MSRTSSIKSTLLFSLLFLFGGCQNDPPVNYDTAEPRGPLYKTKACSDKPSYEEQRKCGDIQLVDELVQYVFEANNRQSIEGNTKLVAEFYVTEKGQVQQAKITQSVNQEVDAAAMKFLRKTKWLPAHNGSEAMRIKKRVPILLDF